MFKVPAALATFTVLATGFALLQVLKLTAFAAAWPGRFSCASYAVPFASPTIEPRHSLLRASNHIARPCVQFASPDLRNFTSQPVCAFAPGLDQYSPAAS